jgi:large-conductance mechanosensitive channel
MQNKVNNRSFGLLFFGVFFIIGVWPVTYAGEIRLWSLILSIIFLISGLLNLKFLSPFKKTWIKFGEIIGKIISPIVLASIFFLIITPISLILRIFGKDLLKLKKNKITKTYWILRKNIKSMKRQF